MNNIISKVIFITTLAVGLPSLAYATPVTYNFTASGFTPTLGVDLPPTDPVTGSFSLGGTDGITLTSFSMTIDSYTYDLGSVGTDTTYYPATLTIGGTPDGAGADIWDANDFLFNIVQNTNGSWIASDFTYSVPGVFDYFAASKVSLSSVPLPAATWLFGSGLIGLIGVARKKVRS